MGRGVLGMMVQVQVTSGWVDDPGRRQDGRRRRGRQDIGRQEVRVVRVNKCT